VMAILQNFVCEDAVHTPGYGFSASGVYHVPDEETGVDLSKVQSFVDFVDNLPLTEAPEVFGMHENANISFQQQE